MAATHLRAFGLAALGLALLAAPARADWTCYGGNPEHNFYTTEKLGAPLAVLWKHATNMYAKRPGNLGGPVISGDQVFFPSKNRIYCLDVETGEMRWRMPEGADDDPNIPSITATPCIGQDFIYVPDADRRITAYSLIDGTVAWSFPTDGSVRTSPILVGNNLYFGSDDDFVYCINARDGRLLWKSNDGKNPMPMSDDSATSPVYYNGVVYINSQDLKLWAFQADTGRLMWTSRATAASGDSAPVAYNGRIYLAAGTSMFQYRLRGGSYRAFPMGQFVENDISTTPIITEKFWYFGDRSGNIHCVTNSGKQAMTAEGKPWKVSVDGRPQGAPLLAGNTLYVTTDKGFLYGIDVTQGKLLWGYRMEAPKGIEPLYSSYAIRAPMAAHNKKLYVVDDSGSLTCLSAEASDDEGPLVVSPRPRRGALINGFPPVYVSAYLWDEGSGINPDTIELLLDGVPIDPSPVAYGERVASADKKKGWIYNPVKRLLTYVTQKPEKGQPEQPLANGPHRLTLIAADWKGNPSTLEWTFNVDSNIVPRGAVAVPKKKEPQGGAGGPGGYPGSEGAGAYPGGPGGPGGAMTGPGGYGAQGRPGTFRGRFGGYQYQNRGRGGYGNMRGNRGGFGRGQGGFGSPGLQ